VGLFTPIYRIITKEKQKSPSFDRGFFANEWISKNLFY